MPTEITPEEFLGRVATAVATGPLLDWLKVVLCALAGQLEDRVAHVKHDLDAIVDADIQYFLRELLVLFLVLVLLVQVKAIWD